jgi:hypothetical protein
LQGRNRGSMTGSCIPSQSAKEDSTATDALSESKICKFEGLALGTVLSPYCGTKITFCGRSFQRFEIGLMAEVLKDCFIGPS